MNYTNINDFYRLFFFNSLRIYSSQNKNMKYVGISTPSEYTNLILENYLNIPIYIEQSEQKFNINVQKFISKYTFLNVINNNLFHNYLDLFRYMIEYKIEKKIELNELFPLSMRVNSDLSSINEYFNVYIPEELKVKLKLYIKKLYGSTELYECDADSLDKFDFSTLTKPLSSCKNKNSIFNRLLTFDKSKILSGYLDVNSYFNIYIDIDEEEDKHIKTSIIDMNNDIKNTAKYLIKEVEYNIKLERKYLLKMEEGFDARIFIYDENKTNILILDSSLSFGELEGENLTLKSNNDVMVYFYSELPKKLEQIKIENINGKNVLLKLNPNIEYYLDYGFKGYSFSVKNSFKTKIYPIENLYNKLRVKLLEKESFYYYFDTSEYGTDVDYDSLNNPKNDFTFTAIPKNNDENSILII